MAKKPQPLWGWRPNADGRNHFLRLSHDHFDDIARLLGIRDDDARQRFWEDFSRAMIPYFAVPNDAPTRAEIKSALEEFQARASAMKFALEQLDEWSWWYPGP